VTDFANNTGVSSIDVGDYRLIYFTKKNPIGVEHGKIVTADLSYGMPEFDVEQYFGTQPTIYDDYDHAVIAIDRRTDKVVGLLGGCWLGNARIDFFYLWTMMVADDYRHTKVAKSVLAYFFERISSAENEKDFPNYIVTKTYNPIVYSLLKIFSKPELGLTLYPTIPAEQQDDHQVFMANEIVQAISADLDFYPESGRVKGGQAMVAPNFFPRMEESRSDYVNRHFQLHLTRSDQILCVLTIPERARDFALSIITRGLKKMSRPVTALELSKESVEA